MKVKRTNKFGKRFGAIKALLIRALSNGYKPRIKLLGVHEPDAERLRLWAKNHNIPLVDAFAMSLDVMGIPYASDGNQRVDTAYTQFIGRIVRDECNGYESVALGRMRRGDFDEEIAKAFCV